MGPEGTSGQWHLPLPMASCISAFKAMFHAMAVAIDFILWHATLVASDSFLLLSLILYEFSPPGWTRTRKMWRQFTWRKHKRAASLSGEVDAVVTVTIPTLRVHAVPLMTLFLYNVGTRSISSRQQARVFLCTLFLPYSFVACLIIVKR